MAAAEVVSDSDTTVEDPGEYRESAEIADEAARAIEGQSREVEQTDTNIEPGTESEETEVVVSPTSEPGQETPSQKPSLGKSDIDAFKISSGNLFSNDISEDRLLDLLGELFESHDIGATKPEVCAYLEEQIDALDESEEDHALQSDLPIPVDMKIGRPMSAHRLKGYALPSMSLGLLKYLIGRSQESEGFVLSDWIDKTKQIEQRLVDAVERVFLTEKFEELLIEIDAAADKWNYTHYRLRSLSTQNRYGYTVTPTGRITLDYYSGFSGLSKRAGRQAATGFNLERLDQWRKEYEFLKLDIDTLIGESFHNAVSESERAHLQHLWDSEVLLDPRKFYRIRWQSQFQTDQEIKALTRKLATSEKELRPNLYLERAGLFARKGTQPFMVHSDVAQAVELNPDIEISDDLRDGLDAAVTMLQMESKTYSPDTLKEFYYDSLKVVNGLDGD